jgi:2,3-bisphosphoglycerate-dependent phosphoglycerate mutase
MRRLTFFLILTAALSAFSARSQSKITTYVLLRHAEKADDGTKDPDLSDAGKVRAEKLVKTLSKLNVDAICSTPYKRTRNTVAPLAVSKALTVMDYDPSKPGDLLLALKKFNGGTVVICGHSNTTPALLNLLTGNKDEYKTFDDADYGNLVIVSVPEGGAAKITWLTY